MSHKTEDFKLSAVRRTVALGNDAGNVVEASVKNQH